MSTYDPSALALHPGSPAQAQPWTPGTILRTPAGEQVFIALSVGGGVVAVSRSASRVVVWVWEREQVEAV